MTTCQTTNRISSPVAPQFTTNGWATLCVLLLILTGVGCRSTSGPGSSGFASVVIQNHSVDEIVAATAHVFEAEGYQGVRKPSGEMVFEKPASRATNLSREGIAGSFYGSVTINRVKADVVPLGTGKYRLECKAYLVSGGSDTFFQDEVPLASIRKGHYQSLLNKVATQLK